ncbi:MAG: dihydrodipicolinate synthase family protein [Gemmatimonadales bacterium]|nr:MAG: dihydrodipicolinate synthase family protein [Gemmatimonadales bacterium]
MWTDPALAPVAEGGGVSLDGILIPAATPFDPVTGDVEIVNLRTNVRAWLEHPILGIVLGGSTGEAVFLERDERRALLAGVRAVIPDDRLMVAGTGAESTRGTVALTRDAAEAGADAVLVQPPAYYRGAMTPEVLRRHYHAVADASPIPVILYQVPLRFSTVEFSTGLVAELSEHPNIIGIKDSRGDLAALSDLIIHSRDGFQVLVGSGAALYPSLEVGAAGGILGVANLVPGWAGELHAAFRSGDHVRAGTLQEQMGPLHKEIVAALGVPGVKFALDRLGLVGGDPRPPLAPLPEKVRPRVLAALERAGL